MVQSDVCDRMIEAIDDLVEMLEHLRERERERVFRRMMREDEEGE